MAPRLGINCCRNLALRCKSLGMALPNILHATQLIEASMDMYRFLDI